MRALPCAGACSAQGSRTQPVRPLVCAPEVNGGINRLMQPVILGIWFLATAGAFVLCGVVGPIVLVLWRRTRRRPGVAAAVFAVGLLAVPANPLFNMVVFGSLAEAHRQRWLTNAKERGCIGRPESWLFETFGKPRQVARVGQIDHWWYAPSPWFLVDENYVGFTVENGRVTSAYMQIN